MAKTISTDKRRLVWEKTQGHCHLCGDTLNEDNWVIEHIVPRVFTDHSAEDLWNLLPACRFCNGIKKGLGPDHMRRVLMYGRYCATESKFSTDVGTAIYEYVGRRAQRSGSEHQRLWAMTTRREATKRQEKEIVGSEI